MQVKEKRPRKKGKQGGEKDKLDGNLLSQQTYERRSDSRGFYYHFLLENNGRVDQCDFTAAVKTSRSKTGVSRREAESKEIDHNTDASRRRSHKDLRKKFKGTHTPKSALDAAIAAATATLETLQVEPHALGLLSLPPKRGYTKSDMIETLIVREQAAAAGPRLPSDESYNAQRRRNALSKKTVTARSVAGMLVREFYGVGWRARYAPKQGPRQAQDRAVQFAKEHSTVEEVRAKTAWAWKIATQNAIEEIANCAEEMIGELPI